MASPQSTVEMEKSILRMHEGYIIRFEHSLPMAAGDSIFRTVIFTRSSLPGVPDRLRLLSKRLHVDKHIQRQIEGIVDQTVKCAETFSQSLSENSDRLYVQGELLKQARKLKDVNVKSLQKTLADTRKSFGISQIQIMALQTLVHTQIETCRGQVITHKFEQVRKQQSIDKSKQEINDLNDKINRNEEDARDLDRTATGLNDHANELQEIANKKTEAGAIGGIVSAVVGAVLAPFTGGLSLVIGGAAAGITMGVNFNDAIDCENKAKSCRASASEKRRDASNLRDDVTKMEDTVNGLQREVVSLTEKIAVLEDAIKALQDVTSFLTSSVGVSDEVVEAIQDMDIALKETLLTGSGFFASLRSKRKGVVEEQMQNLRASWDRVQNVMTRSRTFMLKN